MQMIATCVCEVITILPSQRNRVVSLRTHDPLSLSIGKQYEKDTMGGGEITKYFKYNYRYEFNETQLHEDPNVALFFLEKDLHSGNRMNLQFSQPTSQKPFLPRPLADSTPFSSKNLPEILAKFAVKPNSSKAAAIEKTLQDCEDRGVKGEERFCATSLESMVDFATSVLGRGVMAVSTESGSSGEKAYRIEAVRRLPSEKAVVACHQLEYAYAVFYCHSTATTVAYGVSLAGDGGGGAGAVAVCHRDTAEWNPEHLAFKVLKVKPGSVPICHFLPENHVVWVSKS